MDQINLLNVYRGQDSLAKCYDPDHQPLLPLVEIPEKLNAFYDDGVRIYAKMMTAHPAQNVKALPALNMLQKGVSPKTKTIIEPSSGSTVISLSMMARALHGISDVHAFISNKTQLSRLQMLRFFGLKIVLYGGPSQPEVKDPRGIIHKTGQFAAENQFVFNPGQYDNDDNPQAHIRWTGPQLLKQLPEINVFCTGMGTAGVITGTGTFLKRHKPSVFTIGVCNAPGDPIPGPRPRALFKSVRFPWDSVTDAVEEVASVESYHLSMRLSREGLICGPSSGMALQGLFNVLQRRKDSGRLTDLAGEDGTVSCVFMCCDLPFQYLDTYFAKLGPECFDPIVNENLLDVDTHLYEDAWDVPGNLFVELLYGEWAPCVKLIENEGQNTTHGPESCPGIVNSQVSVTIIDLRSDQDFKAGHLPGSTNLPFKSITKDIPGSFDDARVLETQWREINETFSSDPLVEEFTGIGSTVFLLCYQGDASRMASSILRAKGIEAYSVKGGACGLEIFRDSQKSRW